MYFQITKSFSCHQHIQSMIDRAFFWLHYCNINVWLEWFIPWWCFWSLSRSVFVSFPSSLTCNEPHQTLAICHRYFSCSFCSFLIGNVSTQISFFFRRGYSGITWRNLVFFFMDFIVYGELITVYHLIIIGAFFTWRRLLRPNLTQVFQINFRVFGFKEDVHYISIIVDAIISGFISFNCFKLL